MHDLLSYAEHAAKEAGDCLLRTAGMIVESKGKDIKISSDFLAHQKIVEILKETDVPIVSEEGEARSFNLKNAWIVDPLDGSLNFMRGIPFCAISIALIEEGEPVLGVVYDFKRNELFKGVVGEGSWLSGNPISVSHVPREEAVIMTGFPSHTDYSTEELKKYISYVQSFKKVRLIGSAALSLAYVACGRADAYFEKDIKYWDVAAGLALVKAAGGAYALSNIGHEGKCTVSVGL